MTAEINGVTEQQFNEWRHHPATKALRQYLTDYAQKLQAGHLERWQGGKPLEPVFEAEAAVRRTVSLEIADLQFIHIADFYGKQDEAMNDDHTEADQD